MEFNSTGTLTAKALGKNALIGDTSAAAQLTIKQQLQNTLYEIKLTDATILGRQFQDVTIKTTTKPRKDTKLVATYDVSRSCFSICPSYTLTRNGRTATLTANYKQAGNQLFFEIGSALSKTEKINAIYTARNRSVLADYSWTSGAWTLKPFVYLVPPMGSEGKWLGTSGLTVTRRLPSRPLGLHTLSAAYDLGSESVAMSVEGGPGLKAGLKTPLGRSKGIAHPTLALTVSSTILVDTPVRRAGSKPAAASLPAATETAPKSASAPATATPQASPATEKAPPAEAARPPTPGEQLVLKNAPLDEAFEQNMVKDERGIFTWSTNRK